MHKRFFLLVSLAALLLAVVVVFRFSPFGTEFLWNISSGGKWMLPLVLVAALLDSVNPCAISIFLLTIGFLFTLGKARRQILTIGGMYILGIYFAYFAIGLGILHVLHFFNTPHFMARVGAVILIMWGVLELTSEFFPAFPIKPRIPHSAHKPMAWLMEKGSAPTAFLLGGLVGLCEFPCTGGPYLMILGLLHDAATYLKGLGYLLLYNFVFVSPLIVLLFIASEEKLLEKAQAWRKKESKAMRLWIGGAMIGLGIVIFLL